MEVPHPPKGRDPMPDPVTTCPLCNAVVPIPVGAAAAGKMLCPRCDGAFPVRAAGESGQAAPATGIDAEMSRHREARRRGAARSVRRAALIALSLGVLGVAVGLILHYFQRGKTPAAPHAEIETAKAVPPAEMPGLGYLPAGTDSAVGIELRPLLDALPTTEGKDAHSALLGLGLPQEFVAGLDRASGVGVENVDQAVLGLKLKDGALLDQVILVVHARQSFSIEDIANRHNVMSLKRAGRTVYKLPGNQRLPTDLYWYAPNDRVLVAALLPEQLDAVPAEPHAGTAHLTPRLTEALSKQLTPDSYFWAVLDSERWDTLGLVLAALGSKSARTSPAPAALTTLRTLVFDAGPENGGAVTAWFDFRSEKSAVEFRDGLSVRSGPDAPLAIGGAGSRVMLRAGRSGLTDLARIWR
jgi:hypothetical protein